MGISRGFTKLLLDELSINSAGKSILQLGRQGIFLTSSDLFDILKDYDRPFNHNDISDSRLDDIEYFSALGFENVESCDYSDFQSATHIFDLNTPAPAELKEKYDLIVDGGTMEHIFNVPRVLENIFYMLKPKY